MMKLYRLGWAAGLSFVAYGLRVGIRVKNEADLESLPSVYPPAWQRADSPRVDLLYSLIVGGPRLRSGVRRFHLLYRNSLQVARTLEFDHLLTAFESDLQLRVATLAPRRIFVHAGVVGWKGHSIVMPGRTLSGKSTLVAALVRAGATYYSDEYAVLDGRGRVHSYARPLSLRQGEVGQPKRFLASDLGGSVGTQPLPVSLVVVSSYRQGRRWRPRRATKGQGILALLANTVSARLKPKEVLGALHRAIETAEIWRGKRGEAETTAALILDRLESTNLKAEFRNAEPQIRNFKIR
jgi:hypothetical protein